MARIQRFAILAFALIFGPTVKISRHAAVIMAAQDCKWEKIEYIEWLYSCNYYGKNLQFKYKQEHGGEIHVLNKESVDRNILREYLSPYPNLYMDNLNLTYLDPHLMADVSELKVVSLVGNNLSAIPSALFRGLKQLWAVVLSDNKLQALPLEELPNPKELKRIFFHRNVIRLKDDTFSLFVNLEWLFLSRNNISSLPEKLLYKLTSLITLDLSYNSISVIPESFFVHSRNLIVLHLNRNRLVNLGETFSSGLFILNELLLSENEIESISFPTFHFLRKVQNLTLNHNNLKSFDRLSFYSMEYLQYLNLSHNDINDTCQLPKLPLNLKLLDLSHNELTEFSDGDWSSDLQNLVYLDLRNNKISFLQLQTLNFIIKNNAPLYVAIAAINKNVNEVHLENNSIKAMNFRSLLLDLQNESPSSKITLLSLKNNPLSLKFCEPFLEDYLQSNNRTNMNKLIQFDLGEFDCQKNSLEVENLLCPVNCSCFSHAKGNFIDCYFANKSLIPKTEERNIYRLNMDFNSLINLAGLLDETWSNLTILSLSNCEITSEMLLNVFSRTKKLKRLSLTHNRLSTVPELDIENLECLYLSYNEIESFSESFFIKLTYLKVLELQHNNLKTFDIRHKLNDLKVLNLTLNKLKKISSQMLHNIANVSELDFSCNEIDELSNSIWPESLQFLSLRNNSIKDFRNSLNFPKNLKKLDFSENLLTFFRLSQFVLPNETLLDLRRNKIERVDIDVDVTRIRLKIQLSDNPLSCSCSLKPFAEYVYSLRENNFVEFLDSKPIYCVKNKESNLEDKIDFQQEYANKPCQSECPAHNICNCTPPDYLQCNEVPTTLELGTQKWKRLTLQGIQYQALNTISSLKWDSLTILKITKSTGSIQNFSRFQLGMKPNLYQFTFTDNNDVTFLPNSFLHNATELNSLSLSRNNIFSLPPDIFRKTLKLLNLDLSFNKITDLNEQVFDSLSLLEVLDLSENKITNIGGDLLKFNKNLKTFRISGNNLSNLNAQVFQYCSLLKELHINNNWLGKEEVSSNLILPSSLQILQLSFNKIIEFDADWKHLYSLKLLNLSNNGITRIRIDNLIGYSSSTLIDFENNNISTIEYDGKIASDNRKPIVKLNNAIECDCNSGWLVECFRERSLQSCPLNIFQSSLVCLIHQSSKKYSISELDENDLTCDLHDCSDECKCFKTPNFIVANCSDTKSLTISDQNSVNFNVLYLDANEGISLSNLRKNTWEKLKKLFVRNCRKLSSKLDEKLFENNRNLEGIWMINDGIDFISEKTFQGLTKLKIIDLSGNNLKTLPTNIFDNLTHLEVVNLQRNNLTSLNKFLFNNTLQLHTIDLSSNHLETISDFFSHLKSLRTLNFTNNNIIYFPSVEFKELSVLNMNLTISLVENPISCNCLTKEISNEENELKLLTEENCARKLETTLNVVNLQNDVCTFLAECPENCTCLRNRLTSEVFMFCAFSKLKSLPSIMPDKVTNLNLSHNDIAELHGLNADEWHNLQTLDLSFNSISVIADEILPSRLTNISLLNNALERPSGWLRNYQKISPHLRITLSGNPWICDCGNNDFRDWLLTDGSRIISDVSNVNCTNGNLLVSDNELCVNLWAIVGPILAVLIVILLSTTSFLLFYWKNTTAVKIFLYDHCKCFFTEDDLDSDKMYDAFVSYAQDDAQFVLQHLIPELELKYPYYKLCLHERDWRLGEQIIDQIEASVKCSRRIIFLLSKNFVESMWSSIEFKTAYYQSINDKVNRIIVIVLGELPSKETFDADLRLYINFNTYLKSDDKNFWSKLRYAMPQKTNINHHLETDVTVTSAV